MLLKKPYGLLIKYFKIVHLVLLVPMLYIAHRLSEIKTFLNEYIANGYITNVSNIVDTYLSGFMIAGILLIIASAILIYLLMRSKDKSTKFYLFTIIYYVLTFIFVLVLYKVFGLIETTTVDSAIPRMVRDFSQIFFYSGFLIIGYTIIRGIGFDIKSFNFSEDLEELDISEEDSELIELNINFDRYELERKIRRFIREMKYYILENKLIFASLVILVVIIFLASLLVGTKVKNQKYKMNSPFPYNNFTINIKDALIAQHDYQGNIISEGKYYLVLKTEIKNTSEEKASIDKDDFAIYIDDENIVYPTLDKSGKFIDFAKPFYGDPFQPGETKVVALVYELLQSQVDKDFRLKILINTVKEDNKLVGSYKYVDIKATNEAIAAEIKTYNIGDKIKIRNSSLLNTDITFNSYELTNKYEYEYEYCIKDECIPSVGVVGIDYSKTKGGVLLVFDNTLNLDKDSLYASYSSKERNFYSDFITLRYTNSNDKTFTSNLVNRTPEVVKDKVILQVKPEVANAKSIELVIKVRTTVIVVKLK